MQRDSCLFGGKVAARRIGSAVQGCCPANCLFPRQAVSTEQTSQKYSVDDNRRNVNEHAIHAQEHHVTGIEQETDQESSAAATLGKNSNRHAYTSNCRIDNQDRPGRATSPERLIKYPRDSQP